MSLETQEARHKEADLHTSLGPCAGDFIIRTYVFVRPRAFDLRLYFSYNHLYQLLRLSTFKSQASRWFDHGKGRWSKQFMDLFGQTQIVESTFMNHATKKKELRRWPSRCLGDPSVSSMGLLLQLLRWHTLPASSGGLQERLARDAASVLFGSLMDFVCEFFAGEWRITIEVTMQWRCRWPRPQLEADGATVMDLQVVDSRVSVAHLVAFLQHSSDSKVRNNWLARLRTLNFSPADACPLVDLVRGCAPHACLSPLLAQLLWAIALRLERAFGQQVQAKAKKLSHGLALRWTDDSSALSGSKLDHRLAKYVHGCREASRGALMFGLSTDKAIVHALPLQVTIISFASNLAMLACPQVVCRECCPPPPNRSNSRTDLGASEGCASLAGGGGNIFFTVGSEHFTTTTGWPLSKES